MSEDLTLVCEACDLCKAVIPVKIKKENFKTSITGVSTVVDIHGLDETVPNGVPKHVRILYVDERLSVRSFSVVTAVAIRK
jgi:hypothetical protein